MKDENFQRQAVAYIGYDNKVSTHNNNKDNLDSGL